MAVPNPKPKKTKKATDERKYLMAGLGLLAGSIGLGILTVLVWNFADRLPIIIPIGSGVLLLMGSGSLLKWMLGDKIEWD
mgnify:FL=1